MAMNPRKTQSGFTLIEVMVSMLILAIGILALLALFAQGVATMQFAQEDLIAKQKAQETLESIYAARNTQQITFDQIRNVSDPSGTGIFLDGWQNMLVAGNDGLLGTADDGPALDSMVFPGPDGLLNTPDDVVTPFSNFQRQILIEQVLLPGGAVNPDLRKLTVSVRYTSNKVQWKPFVVVSYVSRYR
ncbi:MAG: type IV pilus modification protein PilV [Acidobacteriia bacterium]|nr:type IV pilus modification protein PilV [Terriglobia bacterium]